MSKSDSETEIDSNNSSASVDNTANGEFHSEQHNDLDEQNETSQNSQAKPRPCWGISHFRKIQMINKMSSLLRIACDLYAGHKWNAFLQLSSGLLIDTRLPDYMLIKHFIFFLYQNPTIDEENFKLVQKYFDRQIVFMEEYFDVTIELIIFLLSNQRLLQTGKLYVDELMRKAQKHYCRSTSGRIAKITPKPRVILRQTALIYYEYLDYIHWKTFNDDPFSSISVIRINKMKTNFQSFLNEFHNEELNLDIVALVLIHLCELDNNLDEALEYLIKYRESFPNNLNSQVYLYEFLRMNPEIDHDPSLRIECLKNIVKLCPDSKYVLHLASVNPEISNIEKVNLIEMICDYLDYNQNQNSLKAWKRNVANKSNEKEMIGGCVVCGQDEGYLDNVLIYCDGEGCGIGVHEACYGIKLIPKNEWFCRPCSVSQKPDKCELCPANYGAFKPTANGKWCHVVCALYIPEVGFGCMQTMEPILLDRIDPKRIGCICILCEMSGRDKEIARSGCSMSCHYPNCPNKFHVTWYVSNISSVSNTSSFMMMIFS
ncbi:protein AF-10-like protein [Sarcoptes scabiei]|uniref:Protein AF-10-like protein n=1 Tax=Sarcoptes scabiei TaxID=52283 RepID=A0A132A545_SARSC|nr:protein AF-10-like protein [Sarcoptes scabiei]